MFVAIYCAIQSIINQIIAGFYAGMKEALEKEDTNVKADNNNHWD